MTPLTDAAPGYASLAVHFDLTPAAHDRGRLAVDLADRFGAHIVGLAAEQMLLPIYGDLGGPHVAATIAEDEQGRVEEELAGAYAAFKTVVGARNNVEWRQALEEPSRHVIANARAVDLIVLGRRSSKDAVDVALGVAPGAVTLECGRPVLITPPGIDRLSARSIVIAWKDTREARRAVRDALPLLLRAEQVVVVTSCGSFRDESAEDVAAFLARHGVNSRPEVRAGEISSIADEIIDAADEIGADLIVAGAYGHSRTREWMFGGVTRSLLEISPVPLLLSH